MGDRSKRQPERNCKGLILFFIKLIIFGSLSLICYQDLKERMVWWFLFPLFGLSASLLHFFKSIQPVFFYDLMINFSGLLIILLTAYLYSRFKLKVNFLKKAFGLGDILFFAGLCLAFPALSFIILFPLCLIFSLALHLVLSKKDETVPLAGYSSIFLICIYTIKWSGYFQNLYFN